MKSPTLWILRTRYPDLAGVLLRDWAREGCLVAYRYRQKGGFHLVGVRPQWRWVVQLVFGWWLGQWGRPSCWVRVSWRRQRGVR